MFRHQLKLTIELAREMMKQVCIWADASKTIRYPCVCLFVCFLLSTKRNYGRFDLFGSSSVYKLK